MSREMNRRAILAGTAAVVPAAAVASVPALASSADAIPPAIVAEFDEWLARFEKWEVTQRMESDAVGKLLADRGWAKDAFDQAMQQRVNGDERLWTEYQQASERVYREVLSPERLDATEEGGDQDLNEIQDALWEISYEILGFEPKTLADLAVQAKAVQYIESEWWNEAEARPTDGSGTYNEGYAGRRLVENLLRVVRQIERAAS